MGLLKIIHTAEHNLGLAVVPINLVPHPVANPDDCKLVGGICFQGGISNHKEIPDTLKDTHVWIKLAFLSQTLKLKPDKTVKDYATKDTPACGLIITQCPSLHIQYIMHNPCAMHYSDSCTQCMCTYLCVRVTHSHSN